MGKYKSSEITLTIKVFSLVEKWKNEREKEIKGIEERKENLAWSRNQKQLRFQRQWTL